jgi:co-chaperonin GroES (HSP10)
MVGSEGSMMDNYTDPKSLVPRDDVAAWQPFLDRFRPMSKRIVITKPVVQEIKESRYILIPDTAKSISKEFGLECVVLKRHPDVEMSIQVGDTVIIPEFAGTPIVMGVEVPFWVVGEGDIMGVVTL